MAAVKAGLYLLAILGVITSVVGAFYYLRIVKIIYFDEPAEKFDGADMELAVVAYASLIFVLGFIVFAQPLIATASAAAKSLF